jgi:exopolysaccharide biosynthesis predicted pyruvyltransferase EpsI
MFMNRRFYTVKISILPNMIYRLSVIPTEIPPSYFMDMSKLILKVYMKKQKTQNSQHDFEEEQRRKTDTTYF